MLEDAARRIQRYLRKRGLFGDDDGSLSPASADEARALAELATAATSGVTPPAGPAWKRGALPPLAHDRDFDRHLSVGRGGFTLHAATRAGPMDDRGRKTLLKYVLTPAIAQERITRGPEGLPYSVWAARPEPELSFPRSCERASRASARRARASACQHRVRWQP